MIQTERLLLRPWREEDAEDLYLYAKDPDVGAPAGWRAHTDTEYSRMILRNVLCKPGVYAVCLKDGKPIGSIGLQFAGTTDLTDREDECELGYWLGKPFWGQGIAVEAAQALLYHAFEDLGMRAVWCGYYEGNEKSRKVQRKLGFLYQRKTEGLYVKQVDEIRTGHVNLMTRERWKKVQLFREQKKLLDTFLEKKAISPTQYAKSFGDLQALMDMYDVV